MRRRKIRSLLVAGFAGLTLAAALTPPANASTGPTPPPPVGVKAAAGSLQGDTTTTLPSVPVTDPSGNTTYVGTTISVAPITPDAINALPDAPPVTADVIAASTGCSSYWVEEYAKNVTHSTIWYYLQKEYTCYNGSRITYIWNPAQISGKVYAWAQADGWSYIGILNKNVWDYYGNHWVWAAWTQGSFKYCPYHLGYCPQNPTPQLEMYLYGDGHADYFWW
jgi:hypothetical protein